MRICLLPSTASVRPDNGIGRVLHAQYRYLPALGFEFVDHDADLYVGHTQQFNMPRIDCLLLHGLYWLGDLNSGEYGQYHIEANAAIIKAARLARAITVPSKWVGVPFERDMRITPTVIGHGIDIDAWFVGKPQGYILWAKNRSVDVCRPDAPYELAKRGMQIVSTYAPDGVTIPKNMQVTGTLDQMQMQNVLMGADVYLATVKETFGIQTVEAMACGVPIVGWNYGGTADIVRSGVDGILVKPYDYDALERAVVEVQHNRAEFSANARQNALRYDWQTIMKKYATLFERVYQEIQDEPHGVSIVITGYNYGRYIGQAVDSALNQTRKPDEVIVVDDGSTDDTLDQLARFKDSGVKVIHQLNQGVAAARTTGLTAATRPYVTLLDADDKIAPNFIESLLPALEADRSLGIAYSNMICFDDNGGLFGTEYPPEFDWEAQATPHNPPSNCIPSACLFRRDMWLRAGPHKQEYAPGEDAEFWTRGLSIGFNARKVTSEKLFAYRLHQSSATHTKQYKPIDDRLPWMRDKRYPLAAPSRFMPLIMSYSSPKVSLIVTVNVAQLQYLPDLIDSVLGQTMREWELIVIDDADGEVWKYQQRYPFMRYHRLLKAGNVAHARNIGLKMAQANLVMFLDGDHMLTNSALEEMLTAHINSGGRYIYTDRIRLSQSESSIAESKDYQQTVWLGDSIHALPALIPAEWARKIGGFFPNLPTSSAEDFYSRLALAGYCGQRLGRALIIERDVTADEVKPSALKRVAKFMKRYEGVKMGSCCGGGGDAILAAKQALQGMMSAPVPEGKARLEYIGDNVGAISFVGPSGKTYRGGNNDEERYVDADEGDVPKLVNSGRWRQVIVTQIARAVVATPTPVPAPTVRPETVSASAGVDVLINPDFDAGFDAEAERAANEAAAQIAQPARTKRGGKR